MILLLAPPDTLGDIACEPSAPSEEVLGLSEAGDLIDSHRGCLLSEALIDRGMHFDRPEVDSSLSSIESSCLQVLQGQILSMRTINSCEERATIKCLSMNTNS